MNLSPEFVAHRRGALGAIITDLLVPAAQIDYLTSTVALPGVIKDLATAVNQNSSSSWDGLGDEIANLRYLRSSLLNCAAVINGIAIEAYGIAAWPTEKAATPPPVGSFKATRRSKFENDVENILTATTRAYDGMAEDSVLRPLDAYDGVNNDFRELARKRSSDSRKQIKSAHSAVSSLLEANRTAR